MHMIVVIVTIVGASIILILVGPKEFHCEPLLEPSCARKYEVVIKCP